MLLPPIKEEAMYGSLATSHINLALRCIQAGLQPPVGTVGDLMVENAHLKEWVLHGHKWWVLPEDVALERQVNIPHVAQHGPGWEPDNP